MGTTMEEKYYLAALPLLDPNSITENILNLPVFVVKSSQIRRGKIQEKGWRAVLSGHIVSTLFSADGSNGKLWLSNGLVIEWDQEKALALALIHPAPKVLTIDEILVDVRTRQTENAIADRLARKARRRDKRK